VSIDRPISSTRPQLARASGRRADILLFLLFCSGYAALLAWFKYVDVYHTHFSSTGVLVFLNNLFRLLFIFYLFWMIQAAGAAVLRLVGGRDRDALAPLDYLALTFFAGAGPWHVVLLAVGYSSLLNAPVMVILTTPIVALSFGELRLIVPEVRELLRRRFVDGSGLGKAACILLALVWSSLFLIKGLYPGAGGGDYFLHYFPAYQAFLEHGSLWPNEVWWHYFYSKGAGLFFLGMLLTDALAPQLVTFCFMSVAGVALYSFVSRLAPRTTWPMISVILFFAIYVYTPGWGEFGKLHELNTSFVIAILWMAVLSLDDTTGAGKVWFAAAASTVIAAVIVNTVIGVFLAAVFATLSIFYAFRGERRRCLACLVLAVVAGALVCGILLINYLTTGILNDLTIHYFWKYADIEKLYKWGALPKVLRWNESLARPIGVPLEKSINFLNFASRLYLLWPLFCGGLLVAALSVLKRYHAGDFRKRPMSNATLVLIAALATFVILTVTEGRGLSVSFYRFSSFMVPVMIVASIAMWSAPVRQRATPFLPALFNHPAASVIVLALCAALITAKTRLDRYIVPVGANALKYAVGMLSADDAYAHQSNGRPVGPWGGIYPGSRGAYAIVGPHTPIWSMHLQTYCMLPSCKMMYYAPFLMTRSWDRVMWGTPEEGQNALRAADLNYFLFSRELEIVDPLPLSRLFSPESIALYLGMRWTDGTTTLLTWLGPDTKPLDDAWVAEYRRAVTQSSHVQSFPNLAMKAIFDRLNATPHPWRPSDLP
jgi:hypothetical protein